MLLLLLLADTPEGGDCCYWTFRLVTAEAVEVKKRKPKKVQ